MIRRATIVALLLVVALVPLRAGDAPTIAGIRVHGNYSIADETVITLAGISVGDRLDAAARERIRHRLESSGRFQDVHLLTRYRTLDESGPVELIIDVRERVPWHRQLMALPILGLTDEYGLTYGGRITWVEPLGADTRLSFPLTWDGCKQAAVEASWDIGSGGPVAHRFEMSLARTQRENPHYKIDDDRAAVAGGWMMRWKSLTGGVHLGWSDVGFAAVNEHLLTFGTDLAVDTRRDVRLPRNAVYAGYGWQRLDPSRQRGVNRHMIDLRGYKGLFGQTVLAGQLYLGLADGPVPVYEKPFLGGGATLRGHRAGQYVGDNISLASLEFRAPLNSVTALYHYGVDLFVDTGTVYDHGTTLADSRWHYGAGAGVWIFVPLVGFRVDVGYDFDHSVRVSFGTGFRF